MDYHIIIRLKNHTRHDFISKVGSIQFNKWVGTELRPTGSANLWWKRKYIHARADQSTSVITLEVLPTEISRALNSGFTLEILKYNKPVYFAEWSENTTLSGGFSVRIKFEAIQQKEQAGGYLPPCAVSVYTRQPNIHPSRHEVYRLH